MTVTEDMQDAILEVPADSWTPAYDDDGQVRDGAWVADITDLADLSSWPAGMRVTVRKERPHPGAQLRFTDIDGHRFTAFATDAKRGQLADLELRHRRRARCEDRIRRPSRPADQPEPSRRHGRRNPGPVEPRPPDATAGQPDTASTEKSLPAEQPKPARQTRERSRLISDRLAHYDRQRR
jgi:Transposase DDE domain group 1